MPQPVAGDVHVNTPLTNISIAFMQDATNFVAAKVFPNIPVTKQSDRYYVYDRGDFNRDEMEERAPGTESAGSGYDLDNTPTYYAPVYSFHKDIDDQIRANADSVLAPDREATNFVTMKGMIKREKLWATKYFKATVWDTDDTPSNLWDTASSTPIEDVRLAKRTVLRSTGFEPNTLVLGKKVFDDLQDHPDFVDRVKYGQTGPNPAMVTLMIMAQIFEIDRVLVMKAIENTAAKNATASHSFIGGDHALVVYSAPNPGIMTPTGGYTFSWTGFLGASPDGARIKRFRMEHLSSDRVEIDMSFDQKLVASEMGYFFEQVVTADS